MVIAHVEVAGRGRARAAVFSRQFNRHVLRRWCRDGRDRYRREWSRRTHEELLPCTEPLRHRHHHRLAIDQYLDGTAAYCTCGDRHSH